MGTKEKGKFGLDIRKQFFIVKVVRYWNRKTMVAQSLVMFQARLDGALSNLCWEKYSHFTIISHIILTKILVRTRSAAYNQVQLIYGQKNEKLLF